MQGQSYNVKMHKPSKKNFTSLESLLVEWLFLVSEYRTFPLNLWQEWRWALKVLFTGYCSFLVSVYGTEVFPICREKEQKKAFLVQEGTDVVQINTRKTWTFDRWILIRTVILASRSFSSPPVFDFDVDRYIFWPVVLSFFVGTGQPACLSVLSGVLSVSQ